VGTNYKLKALIVLTFEAFFILRGHCRGHLTLYFSHFFNN